MTGNGKEGVGYRRPPKHTRWKKGQSGNPRGGPGLKPVRLYKRVEEVFAGLIDIVENGEKRRCTVFEAIVLQLWRKAADGDARALRVFYKYQAYAETRPEQRVQMDRDLKAAADLYQQTLNGTFRGPRPDMSYLDGLSLKELSALYTEMCRQPVEENRNGRRKGRL